ncbi:MAG: hypothetical protein ACK452_01200, partial [Bacteroidota bacterium]
MKSFGKLLFRKLRPFQLIIAISGTLIGLSMLLSATQLYELFSSLLKAEKDIIGEHFQRHVDDRRVTLTQAHLRRKQLSLKRDSLSEVIGR